MPDAVTLEGPVGVKLFDRTRRRAARIANAGVAQTVELTTVMFTPTVTRAGVETLTRDGAAPTLTEACHDRIP